MRTDNPTPGALVWPNPFAFAHATAYLAVMPMKDMPALENLSLADVATLLSQQQLPPVELWHPQHCGDSGMRIAADGTWYHEGSPKIGRASCRERVCQYVLVSVVAVAYKRKHKLQRLLTICI